MQTPMREFKRGDVRVMRAEFSDWRAFIRAAADGDTTMPHDERKSRWARSAFSETESFEHAVELANRGWDEGASTIRSTADGFLDKLTSLVHRDVYTFSEDGGLWADVGRALAGEPDYWVTTEQVVRAGAGRSIVRIVYNAACSGGVSTPVIRMRGAAVAALAYVLEVAGYGVEVVLCDATWNTGNRVNRAFEILATVKRADETIDLPALAMALMHPAVPRRFVFSLMEQLPPDWRKALGVGGGYGRPGQLAVDEADIYVGSATLGDAQWNTPDSAFRWIVKRLEEQGVELG